MIQAGASGNTIGGLTTSDRNILSGNHHTNNSRGILITGSGTNQNVVIGNYVGLNAAGTAAVANDNTGILVSSGPQNNTIGGATAAARNVISGNALGGIVFQGAGTMGNVAEGNWTGLNAAGTGIIANLAGIAFIDGATGDSAVDNVISGNLDSGISVIAYDTGTGASSNLVQGNLIGTDPTGQNAMGNTGPGILIENASSNNTIGGTSTGAGNLISGNLGAGVEITGSGTSGNFVAGNSIGTDISGTFAVANGGDGIEIGSGASANTIGGLTALARNVISGNTNDGVSLDAGTSANVVAGNYVGTTASGDASLSNFEGVVVEGSNNTIGGTAAGARNVISGNDDSGGPNAGIQLGMGGGATDDLVAGNWIGLGANGLAIAGATNVGVFLSGSAMGNTIGGTTTAACNVISGELGGIDLIDASNYLVEGNFIGTDPTGTFVIGNGTFPDGYGIVIQQDADNNTIGGTTAGAGNLISGNYCGISIGGYHDETGNLVEGNLIGTDKTGTVALPNAIGINLGVSGGGNTIGGATSTPGTGAGNLIAGNDEGMTLYSELPSDVIVGNVIGASNLPGGGVSPGNASGIDGDQTGGVQIGGLSPLDENIISGNTGYAIQFNDSTNVLVQGNLIGTNAAGTAASPNGGGIWIYGGSTGNTIGAGNVISGNTADAVDISGSGTSGNVISGDFIGTDISGTLAVANGGDGIEIDTGAVREHHRRNRRRRRQPDLR